MNDEDGGLRALLLTLDPKARDDLRQVLIYDQAERDAIASRLMRYPRPERSGLGRHHRLPDYVSGARRQVVRLLGEIEAGQAG